MLSVSSAGVAGVLAGRIHRRREEVRLVHIRIRIFFAVFSPFLNGVRQILREGLRGGAERGEEAGCRHLQRVCAGRACASMQRRLRRGGGWESSG